MNKITTDNKGQSLMELVIGLGLVAIVAGAIAITTTNSLKNSQFSKNQIQATKIAQENLEKVRTIKNTNFGLCTSAQGSGNCSMWSDVWGHPFFGKVSTTCVAAVGCTYIIVSPCNVTTTSGVESKPFCLRYSATRANLADGFTSQIIIEDEAVNQKKVTSRVFWSDSSGEHSSDLVTIMSRL